MVKPVTAPMTDLVEPVLSAPVGIHNLSAWFILSPCATDAVRATRPAAHPTAATRDYRVLEESIDTACAILHETGSVNTLLIENVGDIDLFIQAGDIVKGGRQDRTIGVDFIVPARSGRIPLPAFCVEQSRWHKRGRESADHFTSSKHAISSKKAHMAMLFAKSQTDVWRSVAAEQAEIARALQADSTSVESPTSLELTYGLEHVSRAIDDYTVPLEAAPASAGGEVMGVAWAIDGKPSHADLYASSALFTKRWKKLLRAAATEALRSRPAVVAGDAIQPAPSVETMRAWLAAAGDGTPEGTEAGGRLDAATCAPPAAGHRPPPSATAHDAGAGWRADPSSSTEEALPPRTLVRRASGRTSHRVECHDTAFTGTAPVHVMILAS